MSLSNPSKAKFMFSDDIIFAQKVVIFHPSDKNLFLSLKRSNSMQHRPGEWDLVGGYVSWGENHAVSLQREILEETQLHIDHFTPLNVKTDYNQETKIYTIFIGYFCHALTDKVVIGLDEHTDHKWMNQEEFLPKDYSYDENRILDFKVSDNLYDIVWLATQNS